MTSAGVIFAMASPAQAVTGVKMAIVYDLGGRGDHGLNDSAAKGVDAIKKKYNLTALSVREMVTNGTESDRESRLQFLASAKYQLIVAVGASFAQAIKLVAISNPSTQFALINDASVGEVNISDMVFSNSDGAYLAGVLAGAATKRNKVGFLGPNTTLASFTNFKRGVLSVNSKAEVVGQSIESLPIDATKALTSSGVDIIFSEWSSTTEVEDAISKIATAKRPIYLIGVNPDQYFLLVNSQKFLLGAVSKRVDIAVADVMLAAIKNYTIIDTIDATNGIYGHTYTVKDGGVSMALTKLGAPYSNKVAAAIAALKSGKIKLP